MTAERTPGRTAEPLVVDASVLVRALTASPPDAVVTGRLSGDVELHAPHVLDVEVLSSLRRMVARGVLTAERAADARRDFAALTVQRYPHQGLVDRAWALREDVTPYDAVYVALAEVLDATLVTCDARLARAPGHTARVEAYSPDGAD